MDINLLAVKLSSSPVGNKYGLLIYPHSDPTGLGLDLNDLSAHSYTTLEQLWEAVQKCELVKMPNFASLERELNQASKPVLVAQMSEETAQHMGFK
jgi:hypothetical protein